MDLRRQNARQMNKANKQKKKRKKNEVPNVLAYIFAHQNKETHTHTHRVMVRIKQKPTTAIYVLRTKEVRGQRTRLQRNQPLKKKTERSKEKQCTTAKMDK